MRPGRRHGGPRGGPLRRRDRRSRARCGRRREARLRGRTAARVLRDLRSAALDRALRYAAAHALDDPENLRVHARARRTRRRAKNSTARSPRSPQARVPRFAPARCSARSNATATASSSSTPTRGPARARRSARARCFSRKARARGSTTSIRRFAYAEWRDGLLTCIQYRVYPQTPAIAETYQTLEMHYYRSPLSGETIIAWMFPKRDHLSIGLGLGPKVNGAALRAELDWFLPRVQARLFPGIAYTIREEGNLLYGGKPRPGIANDRVMVGGTAAGLVDATTGEGILEAAMSGRFAAAAVSAAKRRRRDPAPAYDKATKHAFYARLRHRAETDGVSRTQARALRRALPPTRGRAALRRPLAARSQRFHARAVALSIRTGGAFRGCARRSSHRVLAFASSAACGSCSCCLAITVVSFLFLHLIPGDPIAIRLGEHASPQQIAYLTHEYGLDRPWWVQLGKYLGRARCTAISVPRSPIRSRSRKNSRPHFRPRSS